MKTTAAKNPRIYKLKIIKKGTTWFHVGKDCEHPDYLKINSITESFEVGKEYEILAIKENSYSARWGRKTYYHPITKEDAHKITIDLDIENARKKLERCKGRNSISSTVKNSIIKLAHSNEVILKELSNFEEKLKNDSASFNQNNTKSPDKEYSIETVQYISDKDNNKCMINDKVVVCKNNDDIIVGKIIAFKDKSFALETAYMPIIINLKDIVSLKKYIRK